MRPKLRDDCTYVAVDDGVYLEAATGTVHITGRSAFALVDRIAAHLTGERTLAELTAALPEAHRQAVTNLVTELLQRKLARDVDADPPHGLSSSELARYQEEIAFAEHVANASVGRFEAFRNSRVLLIGAGATMAALLQSLFKLGLRAPALASTAEVPDGNETYQRILDRCRAEDPERGLTTVDVTGRLDDADQARDLLSGYDAVLHCSDRRMPARARVLARAGRTAGIPVLHAMPLTGDAWLGPTGEGACWECLWWNLRGTAVEDSHLRAALEADDPESFEPYLSAPLSALVGTKLAFAYFRQAIGAEDAGRVVTRIDLETAVTSEHAVAAHPRCAPCGAGTATADVPPVDAETFSTAVATLVDERLGPILRLGTGEHTQLPVNVVDVSFADPTAAGKGPQTLTVVGTSRSEALRRAATVGLETIAAAVDSTVAPVTRCGVAGGFTWPEAQVRAILRLHHAYGGSIPPSGPDSDAEPGSPGAWLDPSAWPAATLPLVEDAAILGTELYAWHTGTATPTVFVGGGGLWLARACSVDVDSALTAAVQAALAHLAGLSPAGCDVGVEPGATVDWDGHLARLRNADIGEGPRISLRRLDGGPAVRSALPFVAIASVMPA
ncbi:TOMM precursor leader peptide-binding protein [Micromonospora sp. NPDC000316]|uniref:TOMM precursor leader peptide-binding protein n=1 Tax=Micromonospora sp. NPDC000316 TaxID=3364216 RepID=UPI0036999195